MRNLVVEILLPAVHVTALMASSATTITIGYYAWQRRSAPGALPLAGLMCAFTVYSVGHLVGIHTPASAWRIALEAIQWAGTAAIPVFWILFAMAYTGQDELITPRSVGLLALVPTLTVLFTVTNPVHGIMFQTNEPTVRNGLVIMRQQFGPWFWVFVVYTYGLVVIGLFLLLRITIVSEYLYFNQIVILLAGGLAPWGASILTVFYLPRVMSPPIDVTPYGFIVTAVAFGSVVFRRQLFGVIPATRQVGRRAAINDLRNGLIIVDDTQQVIYTNPAARSIFSCSNGGVLGTSLDELIDSDPIRFAPEPSISEVQRGDRTFEVTASPIWDHRDRQIGHTLLFHDITERIDRAAQLQAQRDELAFVNRLNSVLRDINQTLVSATTRDEIESAVERRLTGSELYDGCWLLSEPVTESSIDTIPFDLADLTTAPDPDDSHGSALKPGELFALPDSASAYTTELTTQSDPDDDTRLAVIPIIHRPVFYGVIVLATTRQEGFSDRELEVLDELGRALGYVINTTVRRRAISADTVLQLKLQCTDPGDAFVSLTRDMDVKLELSGIIPSSEGTFLIYFDASGSSDVGSLVERLRNTPGITSVRRLGRASDRSTLEVAVAGGSIVYLLLQQGAHIRSARIVDGTGEITLQTALDAGSRVLLATVREEFPDTTLLSKQEHDRPADEDTVTEPDPLEELTPRQREALEVAYRAGYFESPRESTAEEVADAMGISSATLHTHLRRAEKHLVERLF